MLNCQAGSGNCWHGRSTDKKISQPDETGWIEYGSIDSTGHKDGAKSAKRIQDELNGLSEIVAILLNGGWKNAEVVTDQGWMLMPGGAAQDRVDEVPGGNTLGPGVMQPLEGWGPFR